MKLSFPIATVPDWTDSKYAAEMTERQFRSIHLRIDSIGLADVPGLKRIQSATKSPSLVESELRKWLISSWNTEHILALSASVLDEAAGAILQWTFPQAYYSCFASTLAFFQVAGFTEASHTSVIKKYAQLVKAGEYPYAFGFNATGTKKNMQFSNLSVGSGSSTSLHFSEADPQSWDKHIKQFLRSTREVNLEKKKADLKLKTASGSTRTKYSEEHWEIASDKIGPTALLCLLYRKRKKANYRDIDTFTESGVDPGAIFESLVAIVNAVSTVNESFVAAAMGSSWYAGCVSNYLSNASSNQLSARKDEVLALI